MLWGQALRVESAYRNGCYSRVLCVVTTKAFVGCIIVPCGKPILPQMFPYSVGNPGDYFGKGGLVFL